MILQLYEWILYHNYMNQNLTCAILENNVQSNNLFHLDILMLNIHIS